MNEILASIISGVVTLLVGIGAAIKWGVGRFDRRFDAIDGRLGVGDKRFDGFDKRFDSVDEQLFEVRSVQRETAEKVHEVKLAQVVHKSRLDQLERRPFHCNTCD